MAKRQILFDAIHVRRSNELVLAQGSSTVGIFALEQMALSCASAHHLARAGDFEAFGYCFSGFDSLGASHRGYFRSGREVNESHISI